MKRIAVFILLIATYAHAMEQEGILTQVFPNDVWKIIVDSYKPSSFTQMMQGVVRLRKVSRQCNKVISNNVIDSLCAACPLEEKNKELKKILEKSNDASYWRERDEMSILIYAGADVNTDFDYPLLKRAALFNDEKMIDLLFNRGADPNYMVDGRPILFDIRSVSIAKKFIEKGVDFHVKGVYAPNILWSVLWSRKDDIEEFLRLYSDHGVDFTVLNYNNNCLLHEFVKELSTEGNQYKEAIEFLINKIPRLLNKKNNQKQTPLDIAYEKRDELKRFNESGVAYIPFDLSGCNAIIALLEKYGAKRASEL